MNSLKLIDAEVQPGVRLSSAPAVYLQEIDTLVVSDVHWGYAVSQRDSGRLIPLWGDEDIAARFRAVIDQFSPARLVLLGDIVHGAPGATEAARVLDSLPTSLSVVLVGGNHDRNSELETTASVTIGRYKLHHGDKPLRIPRDYTEVIGHFHPAALWSDGAGTRIKMPALVASQKRLILPAFSPWAGGVPWNHELCDDETLWMVSPRRIFPIDPLR